MGGVLHAHFIKFLELMIRLVAPPFKVLLQVLIDLGSIFRQVGALAKQTILGKMRAQAFKEDSVPRSAHLKTGGMQLQEQLAVCPDENARLGGAP